MPVWILNLVIAFAIRQLAKFSKSIDWGKVKTDLAIRIADLVPGTFFDAEAIAGANMLLDGLAATLSATADIEAILKLLATDKFAEAMQALKDLLLKIWVPQIPDPVVQAKWQTALSAA